MTAHILGMWPLGSCEDQLEVAHVQFPGYIAAWAPPHSPAPAFPPSAFPLHGADQRYSRAASGDSRAVASFSGQELSRASPSGRLSGKTKLSNLGIEAPSVLVAWPESSKGHRQISPFKKAKNGHEMMDDWFIWLHNSLFLVYI